MIVLAVLGVLVLLWVVRLLLARRYRAEFCGPEGCVTMAVRMNPKRRGVGWKHGFARANGDVIEWRAEHKIGQGADMTFDRRSLRVREHRPVVKGETMLSDLCELVFARYQDEEIEIGVPRTELDRFLEWPRG